jgi:hypothetical protein
MHMQRVRSFSIVPGDPPADVLENPSISRWNPNLLLLRVTLPFILPTFVLSLESFSWFSVATKWQGMKTEHLASWSRDSPKLLQQAQIVAVSPGFHELAVCETKDVNRCIGDVLAGRRKT